MNARVGTMCMCVSMSVCMCLCVCVRALVSVCGIGGCKVSIVLLLNLTVAAVTFNGKPIWSLKITHTPLKYQMLLTYFIAYTWVGFLTAVAAAAWLGIVVAVIVVDVVEQRVKTFSLF